MKLKKGAALVSVIVFAVLALGYYVPKAGDSLYQLFVPSMEETVENQSYTGSNYEILTVKEKYVYGRIMANHEEHKTDFRVPEEVTSEEMTNVFTAIQFDFPHISCIDDSYSFVQKGTSFYYNLKYWLTYDECCNRQEKCMAEAEKLVMMAEGKSDYEKVLFFHDALTDRAVYSYSLEGDVFTAYGAFFNGRANCSGFTGAMTMLLDLSHIENSIVLGDAREKREGQEDILHVWNVAETEMGKGHIDVAWDAGDEKNETVKNHTYFYLSDEEISRDHIIFPQYQGKCPHKTTDYFSYKGMDFEKWGEAEQRKTGRLLAEGLEAKRDVEIKFADENSYAKAADYLFNKNGVYDLMYMFCKNTERIPSELTYFVNDNQYTIIIKLS